MRKNPGTIIKAAKMCKNFQSRAKIAGGPVRQPYARVDFSPPVRDYEFGYSRCEVALREHN